VSVDSMKTIVATRSDISHDEQSPVQPVPAWAQPPNTQILVMLGGDTLGVPAAAQLRVIRHRLEQKRAEGIWTFGVLSAVDGEGKSTFATQLALVLSESQRARVLLIEANFHRPSLAKILGFQVPQGCAFSHQLVRKMHGNLEPWYVMALGPSFHVLAESDTEQGFPETLHSTHFHNAIGFFGRGYDYLVVDGPSVLGSGDANVVENSVDAVILTARSNMSKGADIRAAVKQLGDRKTLGVLLWDLDEKNMPQK
jgi:Mrp family chromosome partitioning ATPase